MQIDFRAIRERNQTSMRERMEKAFNPDLSIARPKWSQSFTYNSVNQNRLFHQIRQEAGIEKVTDGTLDRFLSKAGERGLTVEVIDEKGTV